MKSLQTNIKVGDEIICINDFACEDEVHRRNKKKLLTIKKDEKYKVKSMGYSYDIDHEKKIGINVMLEGKSHWYTLTRFRKNELQIWFDF